ncbi:MAG: gliding motility-associated C-terminal domain-containing protein, partial [Flavobacteriales bacterium]
EPPCPPVLQVNSSCRERLNELVWTNPNNTCANDVVLYYIYYSPGDASGFERIDSVFGATDTFYVHSDLPSVTGCYRVTAVDSVGNETSDPYTVCVDSCQQYVLPSVFTPNGDGVNDVFHPCDETTASELQQINCPPYRNVRDVDMRIFNRWGRLVFSTTDRDINWDGTEMQSGNKCADGTYYYTCKVNFFRLQGVETVELHGTVLLIGIE